MFIHDLTIVFYLPISPFYSLLLLHNYGKAKDNSFGQHHRST